MAAHTLTTMFAQTFRITSTFTVDVVDSHSTRTVTLFTGAAPSTPKFGRVRLASGSGTSESDALNLLAHLQTVLNAAPATNVWTVALTATGYVRITYNGTGTGTLTWTSSGSNVVRMVLGYSGNISCAAGASQTATAQPTHVAYAFSTENDRGWQQTASDLVGSELPNGQVYVWNPNYVGYIRTLNLRWLPKDAAARTSLAEEATPYYPAVTRWRSPNTNAMTYSGGPWSWHEMLRGSYSDGTVQGRLAVAIGDFQTLNASGGTAFECFLSIRCMKESLQVQTPTEEPEWDEMREVIGIELLGYGPVTIT